MGPLCRLEVHGLRRAERRSTEQRGLTCKCGRRYELLRDAQGAVTAIKELDETRRASWQGDAGSSRV